MSRQTLLVIKCLADFDGATQYKAVKYISKKKKIATSTIKYILKKLKLAGLINYNGEIELTQLGLILIKALQNKGGLNGC